MTRNPITITPETSVNDARALLDKHRIDRLPILDKKGALVGIVSRKDLIKAGPSPATTLDIYEISYLLSKLKVEKIMVKPVITIDENEVVEEAARIMIDNNISCLPVMRGGTLMVGIITASDIFRVLIDSFGARKQGIRAAFYIEDKPGQLAKLTSHISEKGGNIIALVTADGDDPVHLRCTVKVANMSKEEVKTALSIMPDITIEDIREL
jgi:acetoin utilization protein AcuB